MGIVLVKPLAGAPVREPAPGGDAELAHWLVDKAVYEEQYAELVLAVWGAFRREPSLRPRDPAPDRPVGASLRALVRCPDCRGNVDPAGSGLRCPACATTFEADYGVPVLTPRGETRRADEATLARLCGTDRARRRIVNRVLRRLYRNERPPGALRQALWPLARRFTTQ